MIWTTPRTARKPHYCGSCNRFIGTGQRYYDGRVAPGHDAFDNKAWLRLAECSRCAERYGRPIPPADPPKPPPYWPYRCAACARYVSNPRVELVPSTDPWNDVALGAETGDYKKCGPQVPLKPLGWEEWFGEGEPVHAADDDSELEAALAGAA